MKNGWFEATNYTASAPRAGEPEVHVKTVMRGSGDPGYELTSGKLVIIVAPLL